MTIVDLDSDFNPADEIIAARAKVEEALAISLQNDWRESMRVLIGPAGGLRSLGLRWLAEGNPNVGIFNVPSDFNARVGTELVRQVINPKASEDWIAGWWENELRAMRSRADTAIACLDGETE